VLRLNTLLEIAGFDLKKVFLLRHQAPKRLPKGRFFSTWVSEKSKFESYQQLQSWKNRFPQGSILASFVVTPTGETLFVGAYNVIRLSKIKTSINDPLVGYLPPKIRAWHETKHSKRMKQYEGVLVIDWGSRKERGWRQRAHRQNKLVLELRRTIKEEQFPGYINFMRKIADLRNIPREWQHRLKDAQGVYLLTFSDGQQYIGSASGKEGFWQRLGDYVRNGHGGNRILKKENRDARNAIVSILEFTGSGASKNDIIQREMIWQSKLGSRVTQLDDE
jgi:hypothetical protein